MNRWQYQQQMNVREDQDRIGPRRSLTPRWDKLTPQQKANLADRSCPLPEGLTPEQLLLECGRMWHIQCMVKGGEL